LQAAGGMSTGNINSGADVNLDGKIGIAEAVYGLHKEAELK